MKKTRPRRVNSILMERTIGKWYLWDFRGGCGNDDSNEDFATISLGFYCGPGLVLSVCVHQHVTDEAPAAQRR